jgi:hypothetical protein
MKAFKWFFLVVVLSIEVFSQSGFYTYLNKSADQLIREKGQPVEVTVMVQWETESPFRNNVDSLVNLSDSKVESITFSIA